MFLRGSLIAFNGAAVLSLVLLIGGCGYLQQISDEGGLWAKITSRQEPSTQSADPVSREPTPASPPPETPKSSGQASSFSQHAEDRFFSLHWTYFRRNDQRLEARGIVENRNGPAMRSLVLELLAFDESGQVIQRGQESVIKPVSSRETRPFQISIPLTGRERTFRVSVTSYEFLRAKDVR
jgi:hypothetical protein